MNSTAQSSQIISSAVSLRSHILYSKRASIHLFKMNYKCFVCATEFENIKQCFSHLKQLHSIFDNSQSLSCVVNFFGVKKCGKVYNTFDGLRKHAKLCLLSRSEVLYSINYLKRNIVFLTYDMFMKVLDTVRNPTDDQIEEVENSNIDNPSSPLPKVSFREFDISSLITL